ncbi:DUF5327 family protein [Bacillus sp. JCM 19041]|uniref:DUF5327 family protein n=1 Tax=Bacillus sp. JCM 19041 TaxID=1460637 RepID=UPI0006D2AB56
MLIQVEDVIAQMERQVKRLRQSVESGDEVALKEAAAMIEGYCQLLKSGREEEAPVVKNGTENLIQKPAFSVPEQHMTERQQKIPQEQPLQQKTAEKRNLLDF